MQLYAWDSVEKEQLNPGFARQVIHSDSMTIAKVYLKKGCVVPEHSHPNEQVCVVAEGSLLFVLEGQEVVVNAGNVLRIPSNVPHRVDALEDSVATDLFSPPRADWIRGDDAYLRR